MCVFQFLAFFVAWIGVVFIVFRCLLCQMRESLAFFMFLFASCRFRGIHAFICVCVCLRAWYFYSVLCKLCLTINSTEQATGAALAGATATTILSVIIVMLESLSRLKIIFRYNHFYDFSLFLCMFNLS